MTDLLTLTLERLWQHRLLVLWTLVGLSAATTLTISLQMYVDTVNTNLLTANLDDPPYAFHFRYLGSWEGNITRSDVEAANAAIQSQFADPIQLPTLYSMRFLSGGNWSVRTENFNMGTYKLGVLGGAENMIQITASEEQTEANSQDVIPALMSESLLFRTGLQVGDEVIATASGKTLTLKITGLWTPVNEDDPNWILPPKFFEDIFLLQDADFWTAMDGIEAPIEEVDWIYSFDGSAMRTSDVTQLLSDMTDGQRKVTAALPGIRLSRSPETGLKAFSEEVSQLTRQLVIVIMPVAGLILYFVTTLAGMLVTRQQSEDIILASRGISRLRLLRLHFLMWFILAAIALGIGLVVSPFVVNLVGRTTSFLRFDDPPANNALIFSQQAILWGAGTAALAAMSGLMIASNSARQSITAYRQQQARTGRVWWQRMYLDVALVGLAGYTYYTLQAKSGITASATEPFEDPLVFLAPTLFSLGFTLLFLRAFPFVLNIFARIVSVGKGVALLMALRELTRSIRHYRSTLLMMCFTLSLIGFTGSMASTLDRNLEDVIDYDIGAPVVLIAASDAQTDSESTDTTVTGYNTIPATTLLSIEGVSQVSRVGRYSAQIILPTQRLTGIILGIDRAPMTEIAHFRDDYADQPLADMLNLLAQNRTGILLSHQTALDNGFIIGQEITIQIAALNTTYQTTVPILGYLDFFPTLDPRDGFFMVTNIDPIFELVGTELPHNVWMSLKPDADPQTVVNEAAALNYPILDWLSPEQRLEAAYAAPDRRGVLGFLSVGFIAAILLTFIASVVQITASFRQQSIQIGALRAMGLPQGSVSLYLFLSQGIAAGGGVLGGTLIGAATTLLYLPLLDFSGGLPPYLVRVAWNEIILVYSVFAGALFFVTISSTIVMGRKHLSSLIKLGDA